MTIGETIDHALKIRDEIKAATGKDLELSFSTQSIPPLCEIITIAAYYKPEGEEKWWVTKKAFDRHVLEVEGKGLTDLFFIDLKTQTSFTDKHRPAPQRTCKDCKYFRPVACAMWSKPGAADCPACFRHQPKEK